MAQCSAARQHILCVPKGRDKKKKTLRFRKLLRSIEKEE